MKMFVVIPAYQEEEAIARVIADVLQYTRDIVVVNDASSDNTATIARKSGAVVLEHVVNRGQGAALQTGTDYALRNGADIIVHFDSDGQHQAKDIPAMIQPLLDGEADIVLGSRFLSGRSASKASLPRSKRLVILPMAGRLNYFFTGLMLSDGHNGWRAMNRSAAVKLKITQDRMAHNTEIPYLISRLGLQYKEVSVDVVYHEYGQGLGDGVRIVWEVVKDKFIR